MARNYLRWVLFQSTHLREVRPLFLIVCTPQDCFTPRTYERCDNSFLPSDPSEGWFQSTHLREVRHTDKRLVSLLGCFNPRTYERCDSTILKIVAQRYIKAAFCETYNQVRFYSINPPSHSDYTLIFNTCETLNNHVPQPVRIFI